MGKMTSEVSKGSVMDVPKSGDWKAIETTSVAFNATDMHCEQWPGAFSATTARNKCEKYLPTHTKLHVEKKKLILITIK